jgi:hypothetical protein
VKQAIAYAMEGSCDAHLHPFNGNDALSHYSDVHDGSVARFVVRHGQITRDELDAGRLSAWVNGDDPDTGERRGSELASPKADLVLDGTINAPKSYSLAALLNPDLATEFEALQDRLRDRIITTWQRELNARRGAAGRIREGLAQVEVVELQHKRSRALDPHVHRHLWLNVKVQGEDGRWSNVDSRVAMKLHTLVNAEGELAARTDPEWVAALARHGYTLNDAGEIAELATVVPAVSRRSQQIEANRAAMVAEWRSHHPGQEPSADVMASIDRHAWAAGRPNKPESVDEDEWEARVRDELAAIDPSVLTPRVPVAVRALAVADLDRDLVAAMGVVDADDRSVRSGGRFSMYDIRAGVTRAVAASGVVADRAVLAEIIDDATERAAQLTLSMLPGESNVPGHVKHLMATFTAAAKVDLGARFAALTEQGAVVTAEAIEDLATQIEPGRQLDARQVAAAGAIAGTDRLVAVTGPAGTGKTTMLRVAQRALAGQGRRMVIVAPTKKAAQVAGREVGADASSLHALLHDHGFRWDVDEAGRQVWVRLQPGQADPMTGAIYDGPATSTVAAGDRIVVDEAGMVDLHTGLALAELARTTGSSIAMVGDHLQAAPVGHTGAMATLKQHATAVIELTAVHRFKDEEYAELSLRMREPASAAEALDVATKLAEKDHVLEVADEDAARDRMVDAWFAHSQSGQRVALVTATNQQAQQINERIQARRIENGELDPGHIALGQSDQRILVGDVVQTRRNDSATSVENRAMWVVAAIEDQSVTLASLTSSADTTEVSHDYLASHAHLAYASTVHGIQGETTDAAYVGPGVDAAGLYVGMTRGRDTNVAVTVARNRREAVEQLAASMVRGQQETTLEDATAAASQELSRAARAPLAPSNRDADARWNDASRRPLGAVVDLDEFVAERAAAVEVLRQEAQRAIDAEAIAKAKRGRIEARRYSQKICEHAADRGHSTPPSTETLDKDDQKNRGDLTEATAERSKAIAAYGPVAAELNVAVAEQLLRATMPATQRAMEDAARRGRDTVSSAPVIAPQQPQGPSLGR